MPCVVANHADLAIGEATWRFGLDLQREYYLRAQSTLQLHNHRVLAPDQVSITTSS